ncbi:MAG: helix-turn-helix domain-containing protein [Christensenellaceae bacterium]
MDEIINRISYFRNKSNLSARELSLRIDKNGAYINHLESSKFNIKVSVLLDILRELDITCTEFFPTITLLTNRTKKFLTCSTLYPPSGKMRFSI